MNGLKILWGAIGVIIIVALIALVLRFGGWFATAGIALVLFVPLIIAFYIPSVIVGSIYGVLFGQSARVAAFNAELCSLFLPAIAFLIVVIFNVYPLEWFNDEWTPKLYSNDDNWQLGFEFLNMLAFHLMFLLPAGMLLCGSNEPG